MEVTDAGGVNILLSSRGISTQIVIMLHAYLSCTNVTNVAHGSRFVHQRTKDNGVARRASHPKVTQLCMSAVAVPLRRRTSAHCTKDQGLLKVYIQLAVVRELASREKESDCEIQSPKEGIHRLSAVTLLFRNNR